MMTSSPTVIFEGLRITSIRDLNDAAQNLVEGFCSGGFSDHKTNIIKLFEEVGELSQATIKGTRQDLIDEIADVLIVATAQGAFVGATAGELQDAIERKLNKGLARLDTLLKTENATEYA